jgi:hypothetical protein
MNISRPIDVLVVRLPVNLRAKYPQSRWVIWLVALIIVGSLVWSQFNIRAEVAQALRSRCEGAAVRFSQNSTWGIGEATWSERSVFLCLRNMKSYQISASNSAAPRVTEGGSWWPGLWLLLLVIWIGRKLWVMGRPSATL